MISYTGTLFSTLLKSLSGIEYPHVSLSLNSKFNELYSFGRKKPLNPFIAGFVIEDIENGVYSYFPNTVCSVFSLEVTEEEYQKIIENLEIFNKNKNRYKYSFLGLIGVYFNKPLYIKDHYFCSQFVSFILKESGIELFEKPCELITSVDFINCKSLNIVYSGKLNKYEYKLNYSY